MPAFYIDANGVEHYYFPPLPKPQPQKPSTPDADTPSFQHAVHVAGTATTAYEKNPNTANTTAFDNDWNTVQEMITEQYRLALNSSDPAQQVASLNQQYGQIFGNSNGNTAYIYHQEVLPAAQKEAHKETPGQRNAEIQLYNALNAPASSYTSASAQTYSIFQDDITVHLQILYGDGKGGAYTDAQYQAAEAAADQDFGSGSAPEITAVGTNMEQGAQFSTLLNVLQTEGLPVDATNIESQTTLTPAQIHFLVTTGMKLTKAQIAALGSLLTPQEIRSGVLTLTPGQAQLAKIDPTTLALLMTARVTIPPLSTQMLTIAQNSPATFFYMEVNGINISVGATPSTPPPKGVAVFNLGHGKQLNITIDGKPITLAQLPTDPNDQGAGLTPSTVLGIYLSSAPETQAAGVVQPGAVGVANLLLGDTKLNLAAPPLTSTTQQPTAKLASLFYLMGQADSARSSHINTTLTSLLAAAPPPGKPGATAYISNVLDPFLATHYNGFLTEDPASFWASSPVINSAGVTGGTPNSSLYAYLKSWLGTQFNDPNMRQLTTGANNVSNILTGATPGMARMLIPMLEGQVNTMKWPENDSRNVGFLFNDFSKAAQIADYPTLSSPSNTSTTGPAGTQVAGWLLSLDHGDAFFGGDPGERLFDETSEYGYTDLSDAVGSNVGGGPLVEDTQSGENQYNSTLQNQLGTANYDSFKDNKTQVLNGFFGQFSNSPYIGKPIGVSNKAALTQGLMAANGFTPQDMTKGSQDSNIINIDLSWINSQSDPGATVTLLPFLFASASAEFGTETGLFFDIWNPSQEKTTYQQGAGDGRFSSGETVTTQTGPTHVLIDGTAAAQALQENPNAVQDPENSDVKWHYSSYRDFQLHNDDFQNGTIYTLAGNQLGIGPNGAASSDTDFHTDFDGIMSDVVGASQLVGFALAPFTFGASLAVTGTIGLIWGTYQGIEEIDDAESHGEQFSLSNPNTRWEFVGDIGVAAGWLTMGVGGAESAFAKDATDAAGGLATASDGAGTVTTATDDAGTVTAATDQSGTPDGVGKGDPDSTTAPKTAAPGKSNIAKTLGWSKKALEYGNYALATVQTGQQIQSFAANAGQMSFWQQVNALANLLEGTVPFAAEPMNEKWFGGDWRYSARRSRQSDDESTPERVELDVDDTSKSDSGLEGQPQILAADPTASGKGVIPGTPTSDGKGSLTVAANDDTPETGQTPARKKPLTGSNSAFFTPAVVDDELATLLTGSGTSGRFDYDNPFRRWLEEVRTSAAKSKERQADQPTEDAFTLESVNELAHERFGVDLFTDGNRLPVRRVDGRAFKHLYRVAGGKEDATKLLAFIKFDSSGKPEYIAVRQDAADVPTLTHELIHARLHPAFRKIAQQSVVNPDLPYSNLSEGAADFLTSQLLSTEHSPEAAVVAQIVEKMGEGNFYRAAFKGDATALEAFRALATDRPETAWESRPLELIEAKTRPTPNNMPNSPDITAADLGNILNEAFRGDRGQLLTAKIQGAGPDGRKFVFLNEAHRKQVRATLLNAWKGTLLDPEDGAKAHTTSATDAAWVQWFVGKAQRDNLELRVPGEANPLKLYFTDSEKKTFESDWTPDSSSTSSASRHAASTIRNVETFLDHFLSGAHFVLPRLTGSAPDLFSAFTGGDLYKKTTTRLANSHYKKDGSKWYRLSFSRGGLRYPKDVTINKTPENPSIISALLVGRTGKTSISDEGDSYFQLEGWPPVKRTPLFGRHRVDYNVHKETGWNISTFGASSFTEKMEKGSAPTHKYADALQLLPSDKARKDLLIPKLTEELKTKILEDPKKIAAFKTRITTAVKNRAEAAVGRRVTMLQSAKAQQAAQETLSKLSQSGPTTRLLVKGQAAGIVQAVVGTDTGATADIIRSETKSDLESVYKRRRFGSQARWQRHGAQEFAESASSAVREGVAAGVLEIMNKELATIAKTAGMTADDYVKGKLDIEAAIKDVVPGLVMTAVEGALKSFTIDQLEVEPDDLLTAVVDYLNDLGNPLNKDNESDLDQAARDATKAAAKTLTDEVRGAAREAARDKAGVALGASIRKTLIDRAQAKKQAIVASPKDYIARQAASRVRRDPWSRLPGRQDRLTDARTDAVEAVKITLGRKLEGYAKQVAAQVLPGVLDKYVSDAENPSAGSNPELSRADFAKLVSKAAQDMVKSGGDKAQVLAGAQIALETLKNILNVNKSNKTVELWTTARSAAKNQLPAVQGDLDSARNAARIAVEEAVYADIAKRTTDTTEAAASWMARDPDFQRGTLVAAQQSIADKIKSSWEIVGRVGDPAKTKNMTEVKKAAKTVARTAAGKEEPIEAAKTKAEELLYAGLPEAVFERNFRGNPQDYRPSFGERLIIRHMERYMQRVSYTAQSYEEIRALLPEELRKTLPVEKSEDFKVDRMTMKLAEILGGLEDIVADIHAHSMGYDRRRGNRILKLAQKTGEFGRFLSMSIPQWCGGDSHYSTATPSYATMRGAYLLDKRAYGDWIEIWDQRDSKGQPIPEMRRLAAKIDLSITGINFADSVGLMKGVSNPAAAFHQAFSDPAAYMRKLMLEHPGMYPAVGEITGIKEMVTKQLGKWGWDVSNQKFKDFLKFANETGLIVVLHNDWGEHAESAADRPSAAKQRYEHLDLLQSVFAHDEYKNVRIIFAHTGIGRLVRPSDDMVDPATGDPTGEADGILEHISKLKTLFKTVPNAKVDISWNDVTQAYTHLMQVSPDAANQVVDFFCDYHDRIFFGSDTVKPVNEGHYNQALTTGSPLFVELTRRDPDVAFNILRGNYDKLMQEAYQQTDEWTKTQLLLGATKPSPNVAEKIRAMEAMREELDRYRKELSDGAREAFDKWAKKVRFDASGGRRDWSAKVNDAPTGVYQMLAEQLPRSTPLDRTKGVRNGAGTSGGGKNGVRWRRYGAGTTTAVATGTGVWAAVHFLIHGALGHTALLTPDTGGSFLAAIPGTHTADALTSLGFLGRAVLNLGRAAYVEKLRLQWEQAFEQGVVTRDGLNRYVSRLFNAAPYIGITALQRAHIAAATEQFWTDYAYLRDLPLDEDYTEKQRFLALHAKIGEYQITVSREGNLQESSLSAVDARRFEGRLFRVGLLATYGINETVALNWLKSSGLHELHEMFTSPFLHQTSFLADAQSASELLYRSLFLLGNAMLMSREGGSLIGGLFGITGMETNRYQKLLQRWGQLALGIGGIGWTVDGALTTIAPINSTLTAILDGASTLARAAFTWADLQSYGDEFRRVHARPMRDSFDLSKPQLILAGALGAAMIISLAQTGGLIVSHHVGAHPSGTPTPFGAPTSSPSPFSSYSPH